jgi:hypothetical protein
MKMTFLAVPSLTSAARVFEVTRADSAPKIAEVAREARRKSRRLVEGRVVMIETSLPS